MTTEQINRLKEILSNVENYLYNDLDVICDEEYCEIAQDLLSQVNEGNAILNGSSE